MATKRPKSERIDAGTGSPSSTEPSDAFYAAAVLGLRALDARERTPRRFGTDADARWMQFAGSLGVGDRLDILLRDAAGAWGAAFSPSECFGYSGLASDEPFGPDWRTIDDAAAKRVLAADAPLTLDHLAFTLGVKVVPVSLPPLASGSKLVVAGGAAIVAVANVFAANPALSWTDQVVVIADNPAPRQLAGLAAVLVAARARTVLVRSNTPDASTVLRSAGFVHIDQTVVSPDAEPEAAAFARGIGK